MSQLDASLLEQHLHQILSTTAGTRAFYQSKRVSAFGGLPDEYRSGVAFTGYKPKIERPWEGMFAGYLKGTSDPVSLQYAQQFFNGNPKDGEFRFIPLNQTTYNKYIATMYQAFLNKAIPGEVIFAQPSFEDVKAMIEQDVSRAIAAKNWTKEPTTKVKKLQKEKAGIPGIQRTQSSPSQKLTQTGGAAAASQLGAYIAATQ
jgi:hypothetical protein